MANKNHHFKSEDININADGTKRFSYSKAFNCPRCKGFSSHTWHYSLKHNFVKDDGSTSYNQESADFVILAKCMACDGLSIWLKTIEIIQDFDYGSELLLFPHENMEGESPNPDMPEQVKKIFNESSNILTVSPRASAALSRLAIELLVENLDAKGKDLNDKIGNLVSNGLPPIIQQALDSIRVIGNNAVHPGQIDLDDNKELAISLLKFINIIVENQITQPKSVKEAYSSLPENNIKAIEARDKN